MRPVDQKTRDANDAQPSSQWKGPVGEPGGREKPGPHGLGSAMFEEYPGATQNGHNSGPGDGSLDEMWPGSGHIEAKRFSEAAESSVEIARSQPPELPGLAEGSASASKLSREACWTLKRLSKKPVRSARRRRQ